MTAHHRVDSIRMSIIVFMFSLWQEISKSGNAADAPAIIVVAK